MEINTQKPPKEFLMGVDVHELLPQKEPFVMIGKLTHFDMRKTVTETIIVPNNIFVNDDYFGAFGLIENVAQTCAARIGYINKYILKKGIQIGFIGAIRNMEIFTLPKVGDLITTTVDVQEEIFGMLLARAVITCDENQILETEMKIAVKEGGNA
ncbi:MAG: pseudouridylate synthase [Bacteroidales bacterium]|nr:pseudouridylate synthase [Bacteroidales bacterium]